MFFLKNVDMNLYCWAILPMPTYDYVAFSKGSSKVEESLVKFVQIWPMKQHSDVESSFCCRCC